MGLRSDIQTDIAAEFDGDLSDAVLQFVMYEYTDTYNHREGSVIIDNRISGKWRGVFDNADKDKTQDQYTAPITTDVICLINERPFIPHIDNILVLDSGLCFQIKTIDIDPAQATYTFGCISATGDTFSG